MRSAAEQKYVAIYREKVKRGGTTAEIAQRTGHPVRTVDRALAWARDNGLVRGTIQETWEECRLQLLEKIQEIDLDLEKCSSKKHIGKKAALYRVRKEYLELYMEMMGIYGKTLNINLHGEVVQAVVILPPKKTLEEWEREHGATRPALPSPEEPTPSGVPNPNSGSH